MKLFFEHQPALEAQPSERQLSLPPLKKKQKKKERIV